MAKIGRPSKYTEELGMQICQDITDGVPIRQACKTAKIDVTTLFYWIEKHPEFSKRYARAREVQAEVLADELKSIADETPVCEIPTKNGDVFTSIDKAGVERNKLRVDTRKWIAAKLLPKKYGDKLGLDISVNDALADRISKARQNVK